MAYIPGAVLVAARQLKGKRVKATLALPDWTVTGTLLEFSEDGGVLLVPPSGHEQWYWPLAIEEVDAP